VIPSNFFRPTALTLWRNAGSRGGQANQQIDNENFQKTPKQSKMMRTEPSILRRASLRRKGGGMDGRASSEIFFFEAFRFDRCGGGLFRCDDNGAFSPVALGSRALDILGVLLKHPGTLVSKREITDAVWPGLVIEDGNLTVQISALRRVLDQGRAQGSCIQTVAGRGYRFIAAVVRGASEVDQDPVVYDGDDGRPAPHRSIAVLPFQNLSDDPEQEYFADGMVEEIITALSRIRWLFVIARNSSFTYRGQAVDVKEVGRELGVRYVLEGSVRKSGRRVRITAQLIDARTGTHLWADRFDGSINDVFELQDEVASSVAGVIEPALQAAEAAHSIGRSTADLTAYDLYLRAYAMALSAARQIPEALRLTEQAIAREPCYGPALAWAAFCCVRLIVDDRSEDPEADRLKGANFARRALEVSGNDPGILASAAGALAYFGEDIGAMMALVDRALALNPNYARGWFISGTIRLFAGQLDIAIEHFEAALRLSPRIRIGTLCSIIGLAHFLARRFDEALPSLLLAIQEDPSDPRPHRTLTACYAQMGRLDEAREVLARLRAISSIVIPDASYLRNTEQRDLFLSGLRLAVTA
jgi:TolB-like protein